jgi:hypothetical protein
MIKYTQVMSKPLIRTKQVEVEYDLELDTGTGRVCQPMTVVCDVILMEDGEHDIYSAIAGDGSDLLNELMPTDRQCIINKAILQAGSDSSQWRE